MKSRLYAVTSTILLPLLFLIAFTVTGFAQRFPICQTYNLSGGRSYQICLENVTYGTNGKSTWTYSYKTLTGNDISHLTLGIPCGTTAASYTRTITGCSSIEYGDDPTTNVSGIKFDCGAAASARTVSFTIQGSYSIGFINYGIKTGGSGQNAFVVEGLGPSCAEIPTLPQGTACENAVAYLKTYGLITIEDLNTLSDVHYNVFVGRDLLRYPGGGDYLDQDGVFTSPAERGLEVAGAVKSGVNLKYSGAFMPPPSNTITKTTSTNYSVNGYPFSLNTSDAELFYDLTLANKAAAVKSDLETASAKLVTATANNTVSGNLTFNVNNVDANGIAVFNIAATAIAQNANVQINNNANAETIVINVTGTNVNWTNGVNVNVNQQLWSRILWNFPNATSISVNSLKGIVLAPKAVFTSNSANEGSIAVKTYNGNGEIHRPYFSGDFSPLCSAPAPTVTLNLTAECKIGSTLYWRVTGDDDVDKVAFSWNGPGSNDGSGTVDAGEVFYFTTQDAGGANTTSISWFDTGSGQTKSTTKAHNNQNCVYHIEFAKEWQGAAPPQLFNKIVLTAESTVATATCGYNASGGWYCTYKTKTGSTLSDLEVPFGQTYSVTENAISGWTTAIGTGTGFSYVDGFDNAYLPNILVYKLSSNAYAVPLSNKPAKYGRHTVINTKVATERRVNIRVLLQGALVNERCEPPTVNIMRNVLQQRGLLPTTNPYGLPQTYASINSTTGPAGAVTDWVRVELRDGNNPANILESQAGLLKTNGQVVNANGQPLTFTSTTNPVYLVVRHRNHVPISSPEIDLADGDTYDFTTDLDKAYSTIGYPMAQVNEEYAMWGGDVNGDGKVLNTATPSDVNAIKNRVLTHPNNRGFFGSGPVSNYTGINRAYEAFDVNLDGLVYDNANPSDANLVSFIILKHPGNTGVSNGFSNLIAQLPFYTGTFLASSDHTIQSTNVKTEATAWNVIKVSPNPVYTDHAKLELNSLEKEADALLTVMNINGQIIHSQRITLEKGANQVRMETAHLPQGTYWLKIIDAAQSFPVIKIIRTSN